ncbi:hypothetical protein C0Q70_10496 [Pomacea canaliculata]|uniref:Essential protein Yae1 N-terminal domain-containing protein n=2 Tax=Pomacea canaliculata TaxID=400727 RepID=A0A2T7P3D0_POMCA|nr:hypothetical protein C0Q70_10496 [Pomacea canaliculata]
MDVDGSDFLEAVFLNENRCQDEGFAEGKIVGRTRGLEAGYRLGCVKGGEIGSELGFYRGFAYACRPLAEQQQKPR